MEKHPLQIKVPELQKSEEVDKAVEKKERLEDTKLPNDPNERIEAYMERLEKIFLNPDQEKRERNLEMLRSAIYDRYIIKSEQVPESYFELQKQVARERGVAIEEISQDIRNQMIETLIKDQKHSLDSWIEYLTSPDAMYPAWFKYFVIRNILKLSQFDKSLGKFKARTDTTVAPYPDIYREPLAKICDIYEKAIKDGKPQNDPEFSKSFPKLYAELITESLAAKIESNEEIRGEWVKYEQNNTEDAQKLFESLDGKGTGWCTAGHSTAKIQIQSGDFYVYYSYDTNNEPAQPRIAIRMDGTDKIGEVRGILEHQAMEPAITPVLEEKLKEFGGEADRYKKKVEDMSKVTEIERKTKTNQPLTKEDLVFLYEIEESIEGFGYEKDPRIAELQAVGRDMEKDMAIIFECTPEQIAHTPNDIAENTKVYVGKLFPGVFSKNIENIFTSFPEGKIQKYETKIGGQTKDELVREMKAKNIKISDYAKSLLDNPDFKTQANTEDLKLVRLTVEDLGFSNDATTEQIYKRAKEFGLDLCPAEVGPHLRLSYSGSDWILIAMKQITDRDGYPSIFNLYRYDADLWLYDHSARPVFRWYSSHPFVFCSRKS